MIMMLGHDGQERREVGREWKNVLFLKYSFAFFGRKQEASLVLLFEE